MLPVLFEYEGKHLRTVTKDGEPWFAARDVCEMIDVDPTQSRRLDEDEKGMHLIQTLGGNQEMIFVNEPGLYSLILGSRKPEAKQFKRWITHEVIPSIRKHGGYLTPDKLEEALLNPDTIIQLATTLKEEREKNKFLQQTLADQESKVIFAKALEVSSNTILIGELAKILRQNGIEVGQNRLFEKLREEGYLIKRGEGYNQPTQYSMELELFEIKKRIINNPDGSTMTTSTTKVTGKGQIYFVNKFKAQRQVG